MLKNALGVKSANSLALWKNTDHLIQSTPESVRSGSSPLSISQSAVNSASTHRASMHVLTRHWKKLRKALSRSMMISASAADFVYEPVILERLVSTSKLKRSLSAIFAKTARMVPPVLNTVRRNALSTPRSKPLHRRPAEKPLLHFLRALQNKQNKLFF